MFEQGDVYRVAYDEERQARTRVRLAILGAGGVAQAKYLPAVARLQSMWEPLELVGLSTVDRSQADKLAAAWRLPVYVDSDALLREHAPDAVLVTSSDEAHRDLTLAALEAGAHVLVEKPIAKTLADAALMCRSAERAGRILLTVCNKRYSPPYAEARRLLTTDIGRPFLFSGKFVLGYGNVDLLAAGTVHVFDLARFFMGDVARVTATAARASRESIVVTLEHADGGVGTVLTTAAALSLHPWERVEIFGDDAWLTVEDQWTLSLHSGEYEPARVWAPVVPNTLLSSEEWGGYVGMVEELLRCARGEDPGATELWDGYRALELVAATRLSLRQHGAVDLPLEPSTP